MSSLEYKEQLRNLVTVPMDIQIMQNEDRFGQGWGIIRLFHRWDIPPVRFTQAYEDAMPVIARVQGSTDNSGIAWSGKNGDGIEDSLYVDVDYLAGYVDQCNSMAIGGAGA